MCAIQGLFRGVRVLVVLCLVLKEVGHGFPFMFFSVVSAGRLKSVELLLDKIFIGLKAFMVFGAPIVLAFCSIISIKALIQNLPGRKNRGKS